MPISYALPRIGEDRDLLDFVGAAHKCGCEHCNTWLADLQRMENEHGNVGLAQPRKGA